MPPVSLNRRFVTAALACFLIHGFAVKALSDETPPTLRSEALERLKTDYQQTQDQLLAALRKAAGNAQAESRAREQFSLARFPQQFMDFASQADDQAAIEACQFIIQKFYWQPQRYAAMDLVEQRHLDDPEVVSFFFYLVHGYSDDRRAERLLEKAADSANRIVRAHARYQLARLHLERRNRCLDDANVRAEFEIALNEKGQLDAGKKIIAEVTSQQGRQRIIAQLAEVRDEFGDVDYFGYRIGERAAMDWYEQQHLEEGLLAPDIEGPDSSGKRFRLSDYRGKVVVIVWWANWCGACMEALPEETRFVTSMQGKPFVWLGVNGDDDVQLLMQTEKDGKTNFRSWHDGTEGPISRRWNVWGWPKLYVIDHQGVIRYKSRFVVELSRAKPLIEKLVAAAEQSDQAKP